MNIFKYIPGFRSKTKWKMIVASLYYILAITTGISESIGQVLGGLIIPFLIFYFIDLIRYKKKNIQFKKALVNFVIVFLIFGVAVGITPEESNIVNQSSKIEANVMNSEVKTTQNKDEIVNKDIEEKVNNELVVHFIDVGQADSIFIDYGDYDILIDAGNNDDGQLVVDYLKELNTDDIEIMVATHPHEDHIGGLDDVLQAFDVEKVIDSGSKSDSQTYNDYWTAVVNEDTEYQEDSDLSFKLDDGIEFKVLEMGDGFSEANDNSVVCMLDYNDVEFLFMGDLESNIEGVNLNKFSDIDVLKLGHHGSNSSTSEEFLDIVLPEYGVISCGAGNQYGHPHIETLEKLKNKNIKCFRTDNQGSIIATTDGNKVNFNFESINIDDAISKCSENNVAGNNKNSNNSSVNNTNSNKNVNNNFADKSETDKNFTYMGNSNSKKFHYSTCTYAKKTSEGNRIYFKTREEAINAEYTPCKKCNP